MVVVLRLHAQRPALTVLALYKLVHIIKIGNFHIGIVPQQFDIPARVFDFPFLVFALDIRAPYRQVGHQQGFGKRTSNGER
ncbi:hypothetical protein D3C87_1490460 [compost metagenome]